jgi:hypothetical protein
MNTEDEMEHENMDMDQIINFAINSIHIYIPFLSSYKP